MCASPYHNNHTSAGVSLPLFTRSSEAPTHTWFGPHSHNSTRNNTSVFCCPCAQRCSAGGLMELKADAVLLRAICHPHSCMFTEPALGHDMGVQQQALLPSGLGSSRMSCSTRLPWDNARAFCRLAWGSNHTNAYICEWARLHAAMMPP